MRSGSKQTVLHYTGYVWDGGGILAVIRSLAAAGSFRTILGVSPGFVRRNQSALKVWRGPAIEGEKISLGNALRAFAVAWRIRRWLGKNESRVYHGHSRAGLLVALWLWIFGARRIFVTVHVLGKQRWFYRMAQKILGSHLRWLSPAMAEFYGATLVTWAECLTDCVPENRFQERKKRAGATVIFGCAGTLVPVKNWELVIRGLALVPAEVGLRVVHVGATDASSEGAEYAAQLKRLSADLGVTDRFEWRGEVGEMQGFFDDIDCLLVASRWEASSVAALEALAAGVPVLAPEEGGTHALITATNGGWIFPADSAEALARRMQEIASGRELRSWQKNVPALAKFTSASVAEAHAKLYRDWS